MILGLWPDHLEGWSLDQLRWEHCRREVLKGDEEVNFGDGESQRPVTHSPACCE